MSRQSRRSVVFLAAWLALATGARAGTTSPECELGVSSNDIAQIFLFQNFRDVGVTLRLDGGKPLSVAGYHDCMLSTDPGLHTVTVESGDGRHNQAEFKLNTTDEYNEICSLRDTGLHCDNNPHKKSRK